MMSLMSTSVSAPNTVGAGPRQRRTKRRAPVPMSQVGQGPWRDSSWVHSFSSQGPSPLGNPQDLTPAFALRKIILFLEKEKFIDVSQLINQLNNVIIKSILHEIPIDLFIENIPDSLVALESLFSKLFILDPENFPTEKLDVEATIFNIVRHLAMLDSMLDNGASPHGDESMKSITNILRIVLFVKPDIVSVVHARRKMMDNALQGIGEHSLVKVAGSLMNLHDGLKIEFEKTTASYKTAIQQLEQLSLSNPKPVTLKSFSNRMLPSANHQVLMTYTEAEIQERLFKNKTVMNAVEANMTNQLPHLIQVLKERIENDKNALLAFGKLRREIRAISGEAKVAPVLTQYSRSLRSVLDIFKVLLDEQFPERKAKGLDLARDQEDQVLRLEEVDQTQVDASSSGMQTSRSNSTDPLYNDISDGDIPPPPNYAPPPIPFPSPTSPTSPSQTLNGDTPPPQHTPVLVGSRRGRSRDRTRRKKGTKSRAASLDRSLVTISRPERESVEDNRDFQMMMKRINSVSASSPVDKDQGVGDSRRSSQSSTSDGQKPSSSSGSNGAQRSGRPTSMYLVASSSGPQAEQTYDLLMQESAKREALEKEKDRLSQLHEEAQSELSKMRDDLHSALNKVNRMQENEKKLNQEITRLSSNPALLNQKPGILKSKRPIVGDLLYEYDKLFANDRAAAWISLSNLSHQRQFEDSDDLKDKVLFSVIVLAFRTTKKTLDSIQGGVQQLLNGAHHGQGGEGDGRHPHPRDNKVKEKTRSELLQFLRQLGEGYDLTQMTQEVSRQLFSALYDYPKLKTSMELGSFIERCVSLAWRLTIQEQPLTIAYNTMSFNPDIHQRAPATNKKSSAVKSYLWPCLVEESTSQCVYKGVVVT